MYALFFHSSTWKKNHPTKNNVPMSLFLEIQIYLSHKPRTQITQSKRGKQDNK